LARDFILALVLLPCLISGVEVFVDMGDERDDVGGEIGGMEGRQGQFERIEARVEAEWLLVGPLLIILCIILLLTCGCVGMLGCCMLDAGC
jgi:hypothetical protein